MKQAAEPKAATTPVAPVATEQSANPTAQPVNPQPTTAMPSEPKKDATAQPMVIRQCVILKRMGPADQITSRMYAFGIRGKQFQYVEGDFPKDVRDIQVHNGKVSILEPGYTADNLKAARESCKQP